MSCAVHKHERYEAHNFHYYPNHLHRAEILLGKSEKLCIASWIPIITQLCGVSACERVSAVRYITAPGKQKKRHPVQGLGIKYTETEICCMRNGD